MRTAALFCLFLIAQSASANDSPRFSIGVIRNALNGGSIEVPIIYTGPIWSYDSFNFRIAYNSDALGFQSVSSLTFDSTHSFFDFESDTGAFLLDTRRNLDSYIQLRVSPAATTRAKQDLAPLTLRGNDTIAIISLSLSYDRAYSCESVPVRWLWLDCDDNTVSLDSARYKHAAIYDSLIRNDFCPPLFCDVDSSRGYVPTNIGPPADCISSTEEHNTVPQFELVHGSIHGICNGSWAFNGDINLNGISWEREDALLFARALVWGKSEIKYGIYVTDVNGNGIPLELSDFVCTYKHCLCDPFDPTKYLAPFDTVTFATHGTDIHANRSLGAVRFTFQGKTNVWNLSRNMTILTGVLEGNTHSLIYSIPPDRVTLGSTAPGAIARSNSVLMAATAVDTIGRPLVTIIQ